MKRIVTHKNPHLDEIMCIWMVRKFLRGWSAARVHYIPSNSRGGNMRSYHDDANTMVIGVGRGKFDEHKGNLNDSATTLVHAHIMHAGAKLSQHEKAALQELVSFVNDDDHGKHLAIPFANFHISASMAYLAKTGELTSTALLSFGEHYLNGVFAALIENAQARQDVARGKVFDTPWGRAVAVKTHANAKAIVKAAMAEGIDIAVVQNLDTGYRSIRAAPTSPLDLTKAYEAMHAAEPNAEWYLHHSKKLLICGSDVAENKILSRASLQTLIKLIAL